MKEREKVNGSHIYQSNLNVAWHLFLSVKIEKENRLRNKSHFFSSKNILQQKKVKKEKKADLHMRAGGSRGGIVWNKLLSNVF